MMANKGVTVFDPANWQGGKRIVVKEAHGLKREREMVDVAFTIPAATDAALRIVRSDDGALWEIPSQFYDLNAKDDSLSGKVVFRLDLLEPNSCRTYYLYYGNNRAVAPRYESGLRVDKGHQSLHYRIENEFYKMEIMPESGQIWHVWNKKGTNKSWHHNEWDVNRDKGGDPCHWAPNCWAAYPERITNGYDVRSGGEDIDLIEWNYAFGWQNPDYEIISGPLFFELRRRGVVWPHPEHTNPAIKRDNGEFIFAEVVYRFYDDCPWFYQESTLETLKDMRVFFIRNCQFVFLVDSFTHAIIAPERDGLRPTDEEEVAVMRLMGPINKKPYTYQQHTISNVLPSKLAYYGFYNEENRDGFALFQLEESNTNKYSGESVRQNHATLFSELYGWSSYFCRSMSYTNQRYNPENATFLPKGERYHEKNIGLLFRHGSLSETMGMLRKTNHGIKNPLRVEVL